jgi:hypothetical protein
MVSGSWDEVCKNVASQQMLLQLHRKLHIENQKTKFKSFYVFEAFTLLYFTLES